MTPVNEQPRIDRTAQASPPRRTRGMAVAAASDMRTRTNRFRRPALAVLALALLVGCAVNPATGARQLSLISEAQEIEMGRVAREQVQQTIGLVEDESLQAYVQRLGRQLATASERPISRGPSRSSTIPPLTRSRCPVGSSTSHAG